MRVPLEWLREYVDLKGSPEDLAERLTMSGTEVSAIEFHGKGIEGVVVGKIKAIEPHYRNPDLLIVQIDMGAKIVQVVTNVRTLKIGDKVPVAKEGAKLAGDFLVEKRELHGIESFGMLCSTAHLGLSAAHELLKLEKDAPVGQDIKNVLGVKGVVLEFDVLPSRGDLQSILGIAREVSAALKKKLKPQKIKFKISAACRPASDIKIDVQDKALCLRYSARIIEDVKIGPSPEWLKGRLIACGQRPVNNVVDATNYVLLETGQPLHAFDLNLIDGAQISVRRAKDGEEIKTIDGEARHLGKKMLVIADKNKPLAVAGVMGGIDTEVTERTGSILLESACFDPVSISRTSKVLKMRSESSARFEKGVDFEGVVPALDRCAALIAELAGGKISGKLFDFKTINKKPRTIKLRQKRIETILGIKVPSSAAASILKRLGFAVKTSGKDIIVKVPLYRDSDITREIDLIEEIARIHGYEKIGSSVPSFSRKKTSDEKKGSLNGRIREILLGAGLFECQTFGLVRPDEAARSRAPEEGVVRIANPLTEDTGALRTRIFPSLLRVIAHNRRRTVGDAAVFEIGKTFFKKDEKKLPDEKDVLSAAVIGSIGGQKADIFFLKGVLELLFGELGLPPLELATSPHFALDTGVSAEIRLNGKAIGFAGAAASSVADAFDAPDGVFIFEMELSEIHKFRPSVKRFKPLPKFPKVSRDIAMFVPSGISHAELVKEIRDAAGAIAENVYLFDMYRGKQVPQGFAASAAYRVDYRDAARTLTDEDVNAIHDKVMSALASKFNVMIRKQNERPNPDGKTVS